MELNEIVELMKAVSDYGLTEIKLEQNGMKLVMKRDHAQKVCAEKNQESEQSSLKHPESILYTKESEEEETSGVIIQSPLVGTFYASPSPEAESYVHVGDHVKKGQVVGIVEAMKLMNEIESEADGVVEEILVENETVVEYGQPLFRIRSLF